MKAIFLTGAEGFMGTCSIFVLCDVWDCECETCVRVFVRVYVRVCDCIYIYIYIYMSVLRVKITLIREQSITEELVINGKRKIRISRTYVNQATLQRSPLIAALRCWLALALHSCKTTHSSRRAYWASAFCWAACLSFGHGVTRLYTVLWGHNPYQPNLSHLLRLSPSRCYQYDVYTCRHISIRDNTTNRRMHEFITIILDYYNYFRTRAQSII